ncbi:MAG: hypothetical protein AAGC93_29140, partial [Cyanobacteria bacterium P01_F01_bin.53]
FRNIDDNENSDNKYNIAFSPKGVFAVGSPDSTIKLWSFNGELLERFTTFGAEVTALSFSPDGERIASGGKDGKVRLWSSAGQLLGEFPVIPDLSVVRLSFSPDGENLAVVMKEQFFGRASPGEPVFLAEPIFIWRASPDSWLEAACNRLQYHPMLNQPETLIVDPDFLQAAYRARSTCQQRVWGYSSTAKWSPINWFGDDVQLIGRIFGR